MKIDLPFPSEVAQRFDALYQFVSRKYELKQTEVKIMGKEFTLFTVKSIDELLDQLIEKGPTDEAVKDERLPYWPEIWPSSVALSKYIMEKFSDMQNCKAIELGCGIGLVGIVAAIKNVDIVLTDYQPDALLFAEMNWLINLGRSPSTIQMDWRLPDLSEEFDLIFGSDIIYEERFFWPLIELFQRFSGEDTHILLSEPNRKVARRFFNLLRKEGFTIRKDAMIEKVKELTFNISIYDITRSNS